MVHPQSTVAKILMVVPACGRLEVCEGTADRWIGGSVVTVMRVREAAAGAVAYCEWVVGKACRCTCVSRECGREGVAVGIWLHQRCGIIPCERGGAAKASIAFFRTTSGHQ